MRGRQIVELRFGLRGEPRSIEAIGAELGVTRGRVKHFAEQGLNWMMRDLAA